MSMRTKTGVATSTAMDKTVVVTVHSYKRHPKYMKRFRTTKKFYAHDAENSVRQGDTVLIQETRPYSKLKRWKVVEVLASGAEQVPVAYGASEVVASEVQEEVQV